MKTFLLVMVSGILFLVGCADGGPEDIIEDHGPTIVISARPEGVEASWVLTGPSGYSLSDSGSVFLEAMETGDYSLDWAPVEGWRNTPLDETRTLMEDSTVVFVGEYSNDLPIASTSDRLLQNFEEIYSGMLADEFPEMLHPDFQLILTQTTINHWGLPAGSTFDSNTMATIHENIFGGIDGTDANGHGLPPIERIEVSVFERIGDWVEILETDPEFPGCSRALYGIKMFFHDNTGTHAYAVNQQAIFYASPVDGVWYLQGIRGLDMSQVLASEETNYDLVLSLYR